MRVKNQQLEILYGVTGLSAATTECIMGNVRLDELQARIKIGGRNINNLRYEDDT